MKKESVFSGGPYFGFAAYVKTSEGDWRLVFNWKRIIIVCVSFVVFAYVAIAAIRFSNDKYKRGWEGASFPRALAMPFVPKFQEARRRALADFYMEKARNSKSPASIVAFVRLALGYNEQNSDARISFSYLMFYQRLIHDSAIFLAEGLPGALDHREYATHFVRRCLAVAEDQVLIDAAQEFVPDFDKAIAEVDKKLANENVSEEEKNSLRERRQILESNRTVLAVGAVQAAILRGKFTIAKKIIADFELEKIVSGRVLLAQILWEDGEKDRAIALLDKTVEESNSDVQVILLRSLYLSSMKRHAAARSGIVQAILKTNSPELRVRLMLILKDQGELSSYREMVEDFIRRYENNPAALIRLSQFATEQNDVPLIERILKIAEKKVFGELPTFEMHYLEALIANDRPKEALAMMDRLSAENGAWIEANSSGMDALKTGAHFKAGNDTLGKWYLESAIKNRSISAGQLIVLGKRLSEMGHLEEARDAFETAYQLENFNSVVLVALVDYALEKNDVNALLKYLPRMLNARRPSRLTLERVKKFLGSDKMMFLPDAEKFYSKIDEILISEDGDKLFTDIEKEYKDSRTLFDR